MKIYSILLQTVFKSALILLALHVVVSTEISITITKKNNSLIEDVANVVNSGASLTRRVSGFFNGG